MAPRAARLVAGLTGSALVVGLAFGVAVASPDAEVVTSRSVAVPAPAGVEQRQIDELTREGMAPPACGFAPLGVLTASGGAEKADTPQGEGFRRALAGMADSMSPQTPDNWVVLEQKPDYAMYGQREGAVGIGATFGIERRDGAWVFGGSGGCGPVAWADHRRADRPGPYTEAPGRLRVTYDGGSCDTRLDALQVFESEHYVDVLLLRPPPPPHPVGCAGVGVERAVAAPLLQPVGNRRVRDIGVIPAVPLLSVVEDEAQRSADEAAGREVDRMCAVAAKVLGKGTPEIAYTTDVASVRAAVSQAREAWRDLGDDTLAADCYLPNRDGSYTVVDAARGVDPMVRNPHHTAPLRDRVPEVDGRPYR